MIIMMLQFPLYVIVLSSFFVVNKVQAISGQEIASKWAISDPTAVYDSGSNTFTMTYSGTSAGTDASNFRVSFYDKHCKDPEEIDGTTPSQYELDKGINADAISITNSYVFPTTVTSSVGPYKTGGFVHGLCVLGATSATASSSDEEFTYTPLTSVFATNTKLWNDRGYLSVDVEGGGAALCEGGLYLQPSGVFVSFQVLYIITSCANFNILAAYLDL